MTSTATLTATYIYKSFINYVETRSRMVPGAGIEPARYFYRGILRPLQYLFNPYLIDFIRAHLPQKPLFSMVNRQHNRHCNYGCFHA